MNHPLVDISCDNCFSAYFCGGYVTLFGFGHSIACTCESGHYNNEFHFHDTDGSKIYSSYKSARSSCCIRLSHEAGSLLIEQRIDYATCSTNKELYKRLLQVLKLSTIDDLEFRLLEAFSEYS